MTPERWKRLNEALSRRQGDLTVVLENVHKPHNVAAIVRTADAVGLTEVHAYVRPGALRRGTLKRHPFVAGGSDRWVEVAVYDAIRPAIERVRASGLTIVAAHLTPAAVDFRAVDYTRPTAVLLGQELFGVSAEACALVDRFIKIPMVGLVGSLNVSVAAAVILFEAQRQRAAAGFYETCRLEEEARRKILFQWAYPEIAAYCRAAGRPYPRLDEEGELAEPVLYTAPP